MVTSIERPEWVPLSESGNERSSEADLSFEIVGHEGLVVDIAVHQAVIAAFTGRDKAAVDTHIAELASIGVRPPQSTPAFYEAPASLITQSEAIRVGSSDTSGEAEAVLIVADGRWLITVGSDHTDRVLETSDLLLSKLACSKVVAKSAFYYEDIADEWDQLRLRSATAKNGEPQHYAPYQDAGLAELLPLDELVDEVLTAGLESLAGTAVFLGTIPLVDGVVRYDPLWQASLSSRRHEITASYTTVVAPDTALPEGHAAACRTP